MAIDKVTAALIGEFFLNVESSKIMRNREQRWEDVRMWNDDIAVNVLALEKIGVPMLAYREINGEPGAVLTMARYSVTPADVDSHIEMTKAKLRRIAREAKAEAARDNAAIPGTF